MHPTWPAKLHRHDEIDDERLRTAVLRSWRSPRTMPLNISSLVRRIQFHHEQRIRRQWPTGIKYL